MYKISQDLFPSISRNVFNFKNGSHYNLSHFTKRY